MFAALPQPDRHNRIVLTCPVSRRSVRPRGALSRGAVVAGRVAFVVTAFAAIATVFLMFSSVNSGSVDCGKLADYPTSEYAVKDGPIPVKLSGCEPALHGQAFRVAVGRNLTGIAFVIAVTLSLSAKLLGRAESAAAATIRQRQISRIRPGDDIEVVSAGDQHHGRIGRVVEALHSADEFDVAVIFDEAAAAIYAYRYSELKPSTVRS